MRPPSGGWIVGLGVLLCVIVLLMSAASGSHKQAAPAATVTPAPTTTTSPKEKKQKKEAHDTAKPKTRHHQPNPLNAAVIKLARAYYFVRYTDTEGTHRAYLRRHGPTMTAGLIDSLNFGLDEKDSGFNLDRHENRLSLHGAAQQNKLVSVQNGDVNKRLVTVPVIVSAVRPDGVEKYHFSVSIRTTWEKRGNTWTLTSFTEYQPGSDGE
jgi:hypothetical protein